MDHEVIKRVSRGMLKGVAAWVVVFGAAASHGNVTWHSDNTKATAGSGQGTPAFTDMSYWLDESNQPGSGTPTANDDLVFDNLRLRFGRVTFEGNSLQIGTDSKSSTVVFDSSPLACANEGLKLKHGNWWFNSTGTFVISSDVTILAEDPAKPFVMHFGQAQYSNGTARIAGKLKGGPNAQLRLGPWTGTLGNTGNPVSAWRSTFRLDDISEYAGTITVKSKYGNDAANTNFGTRLWLEMGTTTSAAKLHIESGGSLYLPMDGQTVTVKELTLADGTFLWYNHKGQVATDKLWHVRATDALTVEKGPRKIEILWCPIVRGPTHFRIPILTGPAGSTFEADDFKITFCDLQYNLDLHLEVDTDPETGERTLYASTHGFVYQQSSYSGEKDRDGTSGAPSSLTNAPAWWGDCIPGPDTTGALYRTALSLRTLYTPNEPFAFPCAGFWVNHGTLIIQTRTFEVPEFWCDWGVIGIGQGHYNGASSLIAPKIHFFRFDGVHSVTLRTYANQTFVIKGELDGDTPAHLVGWGGTGQPKANFLLDGPNTNYTGAILVRTDETRPAYHNFNNFFPTLYVLDGRNLGGRMPSFDPRALTLTTLARLSVTNNATVTLADGLNRGVYIKGSGRFHVTGAGTLDVKWPLLLSGKMWKEGTGTLVLGGAMKHEAHDNGTLTDVPRAGSNLFEIVSGTVKIAHADALAGVETHIDAGASLVLPHDPANADLTNYGIRNTTVDTPFTLDASFGGKLPLTLSTEGYVVPENCHALTNALVTVKDTSAAAVRAMLPALRPWKPYGLTSTVVPRANPGENTTTFLLVSKHSGCTVIIR